MGWQWVIVQIALFLFVGYALVSGSTADWGFVRWLGAPGVGVGMILLLPALLAHGRKLTPLPEPNPELGLIQKGVYTSIRHPIYLGLMLLTWGLAMVFQKPLGLLGAALLTLFFNLKAREEERRLVQRYPEYADYQKMTGRFLPPLFSRQRNRQGQS
ncbi:MAG: isoprenylcysteine carboxylmethyltransferase family protein [Fimbriimonadales bacterium]